MSEKNVYQKLLEVRKNVSYLKKEQKAKQYSYVGSSDVLGALREIINEVGLILEPAIHSHNVREFVEEKEDRYNKGTMNKRITYFTELDMTMTWVNVDDPSDRTAIPWYAQGVDIAGEKGVGKALTYGEKYFMLKYFNIPTDSDDPDAFQEKLNSNKPPKKVTKQQVTVLQGLVKAIAKLTGQGEQEAEIKLLEQLGNKTNFNEFDVDEYGIALNKLNTWKTAYEKKAKKEKETKKAGKEKQESMFEGNTITPK